MTILWEVTAAFDNQFASYTYASPLDLERGTFETDGHPKRWSTRPAIARGILPNKKKMPPIPPIGHLNLASLVLQPQAVAVLGEFLCQFGELLDVEFEGSLVYFYNVTTLLAVVDEAKSQKTASGKSITRPAFFDAAIPPSAMLFKAPETANTSLYATNEAKLWLETVLKANKLNGLSFFDARVF
jgi:hypothetical protein